MKIYCSSPYAYELDTLVGKNSWIKVEYADHGEYWVRLLSDTGNTYTMNRVSCKMTNLSPVALGALVNKVATCRKDDLEIIYPMQMLTMDELLDMLRAR